MVVQFFSVPVTAVATEDTTSNAFLNALGPNILATIKAVEVRFVHHVDADRRHFFRIFLVCTEPSTIWSLLHKRKSAEIIKLLEISLDTCQNLTLWQNGDYSTTPCIQQRLNAGSIATLDDNNILPAGVSVSTTFGSYSRTPGTVEVEDSAAYETTVLKVRSQRNFNGISQKNPGKFPKEFEFMTAKVR